MGFNLKSAGVSVDCRGNESQLMDCSVYDEYSFNPTTDPNCRGGTTTIACLAKGDTIHNCNMVLYSNMLSR